MRRVATLEFNRRYAAWISTLAPFFMRRRVRPGRMKGCAEKTVSSCMAAGYLQLATCNLQLFLGAGIH
jgi:hypothetical protein